MVQEKKILPSRVLDDENKGIGLDLGFESIAGPLWNSVLCMWKQKFLLLDRARSYRATWQEDPMRLCLCRHMGVMCRFLNHGVHLIQLGCYFPYGSGFRIAPSRVVLTIVLTIKMWV